MVQRRLVAPNVLVLFYIGVNLLLGSTFWFFETTNYSPAGTLPDFLFALFALFVALAASILIPFSSHELRPLVTLSSVPSLAGIVPYVLFIVIAAIPPFTLGLFFIVGEIADETVIQEAVSPDGWSVAKVYFRGVGAYAGGNGRISVRVVNRWVPFLERDVFYLGRSYADRDDPDYVKWRDNNTLYISETKEEVHVRLVELELPLTFRVALFILGLVYSLINPSPPVAPPTPVVSS